MKCRRLATWRDEQGIEHKDVVWFGSLGINIDIPKDLTFENATWAQIQQVIDRGLYKKYFHLGDTKTFDYNGETKTCRIIGFDHDDNGFVSAITCDLFDLPYATIMIKEVPTTNATISIDETVVYTTAIPIILDRLPLDMVNAMNITTKRSLNAVCIANQYTSPSYTDYSSKLFLFSVIECNSTSIASSGKEGSAYKYYVDNQTWVRQQGSWLRTGIISGDRTANWDFMSSKDLKGDVGTTGRDIILGFTIGKATAERDEEYPANFFNPDDKHDNYSDKQQAVVDSLTQRLSVIKRELWYDINYGLPLLDKQKSKVAIDAFVGKTVLAHPDVDSIKDFKSEIINKVYTCSMKIITKYGDIILTV